ncbi:MAG: DUF1307 domain-containing protein [bacterium]|nr:DUF1307 domain-containing protein [bacterium]
MKKGVKYFSLILVMFVGVCLLAGCNNSTKKGEKTLTCTMSSEISKDLKTDLSYKITYEGDYVTKLVTQEKVISSDNSTLELYKEQVESLYAPYKKLDHYDYKVTIDGDTMTSDVTIDYSKIDMDKFIEIDESNSALIKNGKVKLEDIKEVYEAIGATCK